MSVKEQESGDLSAALLQSEVQEPTEWLRDEQSDDTAELNEELRLMQEDNTHVTPAIVQHLLAEPDAESVRTVVVPHLCCCSWCRSTVDQALELSGTSASHPAQRLLAQAEDWAKWSAAGQQATQAARTTLHAQGLPVVFSHEGEVWEEDADGSMRKVTERNQEEVVHP